MRAINRIDRGAAMMEATFTIAVSLGVVFSLFNVSLAIFQQVGVQHALYEAGRFASLGRTINGLPRVQAVEKTLLIAARGYGVNLARESIQICPITNLDCSPNHAGGSGERIVIRAQHPVRLFGYPVLSLTREVSVLNHVF